MKLKYTIILVSLATPIVTVAETDCLQDKNKNLYEIISCLNNEIGQLKSKLAKKEKVFPAKFFRDRLKNGGFGPEMVLIPAGYFRMGDIQSGGDSDEQPVHSVYVNKFAMGKFEVTFAEYDKFADATDRKKPSDNGWGRGNRPVINVSWHDATAYTEWLSNQTGFEANVFEKKLLPRKEYRLPTEAEWEYAARAGTDTKYWWGNDIDKSKANYNRNLGKTYPVGNYKPNQFGLYDTVGNLWEWTCSKYTYKYNNVEKQCVTYSSRFVLRGGSWNYGPRALRSANRYRNVPTNRNEDYGFRLVRL